MARTRGKALKFNRMLAEMIKSGRVKISSKTPMRAPRRTQSERFLILATRLEMPLATWRGMKRAVDLPLR